MRGTTMTSEALAATTAARTPQKSLTCALCLEVYTSPRLLPCHHTFCLTCLEGLASAHGGKTFPCPSCRKPTAVPPKEGVQAFQSNFYITEEELERARSGTDSATCLQHPVELLVFLCEDCDKVICIRCKLTEHERHKTEDLPKAAARCQDHLAKERERLQDAINRLDCKVKEGQDNLKAAQAKAEAVKEQVDAQHDALVANASRWRQAVLVDLAKVKAAVEEQLTNDIRLVQQERDSLLQFRRRLDLTLEDPSDAELVDFDREMRTGDGSEEELARIESKVPTTTLRLGLHSDVSNITGVDICRFLGRPVKLVIPPTSTPAEIITPHVRCGDVAEAWRCEVHAMCVLDDGSMHVTYGTGWWEYTDDSWLCVTKRNREIPIDIGLRGRVTFKKYDKDKYLYSPYVSDDGLELRLNPKSRSMCQLDYAPSLPAAVKQIEVTCSCPVEVEEKVEFTLSTSRPFAFDVSGDGELFAILEEEASEGSLASSSRITNSVQRETACKPGDKEANPNSSQTSQSRGGKTQIRESQARSRESQALADESFERVANERLGQRQESSDQSSDRRTDGQLSQERTTSNIASQEEASEKTNEAAAVTRDGYAEGGPKVQRNFRTEQCRAANRVVRLYRKHQNIPISTYTASSLPTDVCFWGTGEEERLMVTDWLNDCVHVVRVQNDICHFERYLSAGCSDLVRPTALDTDCRGNLWIGCSTGWVLKCERILEEGTTVEDLCEPDEETQSDVDDDVDLIDA